MKSRKSCWLRGKILLAARCGKLSTLRTRGGTSEGPSVPACFSVSGDTGFWGPSMMFPAVFYWFWEHSRRFLNRLFLFRFIFCFHLFYFSSFSFFLFFLFLSFLFFIYFFSFFCFKFIFKFYF